MAKKKSSEFEKSTPSLVTDKETLPMKLFCNTGHLTSVSDAVGKTGTIFDPNLHARFCPLINSLPVNVTIKDDEEDVAEGLMLNSIGAGR